MARVLVVDDDHTVREVVVSYLRAHEHEVVEVGDGEAALREMRERPADLVVLDLMLPGIDGIEVCRRMRESGDVPVVMLTALGEETDRVVGLEVGADDYVTKPFSPRQLAMRIRAVWRRSAPSGEPEAVRELRVGELLLDAESHDVRFRDEPIQLTPIEFKLLYILAANTGRVVSTSRMVDYAWGYDGGDVSLLKTHVSHIRKKLGLPHEDLGEIRAIPRVGYRFTRTIAEAS
jgi:DNA-binding response OmpR family regulator